MTLDKSHRLLIIIAIYSSFFVAEISAGFYTRSLALVADAFHCLNDLLGFVVALTAIHLTERHAHPSYLSFGWRRAQVLGAFFNGVFLLALGIGTFLQSIERFISLQHIKDAKLVLVIGSIGLTMNLVSVLFLYDHDHSHHHHHQNFKNPSLINASIDSRCNSMSQQTSENLVSNHNHLHHGHGHGHDIGMIAIMAHMASDAINNIGIIIAALVVWKGSHSARYYADPIVSTAIAIMILATGIPICKTAGLILMESVPTGLCVDKVKIDLEKIPGVIAVHNLRVWSLNHEQTLASVCVLISDDTMEGFEHLKRLINECLSDYGVHFTTIQPELVTDTQLLKPFVISTPEEVAQLIPEVMKIAF